MGDIKLTKKQVVTFFELLQSNLNRSKVTNQEVYRLYGEDKGTVEVITKTVITRIKLLKKVDPDKKLEKNKALKGLWNYNIQNGKTISEELEKLIELINFDTVNEYLKYLDNPKEVVIQNKNYRTYNVLAIYIGFWGIRDFISENPETLFRYLSNYYEEEELKSLLVERIDPYFGGSDSKGAPKKIFLLKRLLLSKVVLTTLIIILLILTLHLINLNKERGKENSKEPFSLNYIREFSKDAYGILVLRFEGDNNNILQKHIKTTLEENIPQKSNIKVVLSDKNIELSGTNDATHDKARIIGKNHGAQLVIWGYSVHLPESNLFHPRVTFVNQKVNNYFGDKTLQFFDWTSSKDFNRLIQQPILFTNFIVGLEQMSQENFSKAFESFNYCVRMDSSGVLSLMGIFYRGCVANILYNRNRSDSVMHKHSIDDLRYVVRNDSTKKLKPYALYKLMRTVNATNYEESVMFFDLILGLDDVSEILTLDDTSFLSLVKNARFDYYIKTGVFFMKNPDDLDIAIKYFNKCIFENRNSNDCYYHLAQALMKKGNFNEAINAINEAILIDSTFKEYYLLRGKLFVKVRKYNEAQNEFNRALSLGMDKIKYYKEAAYLDYLLDNLLNAIKAYERLELILPADDSVKKMKGMCLLLSGNINNAYETFSTIDTDTSTSDRVFYLKGICEMLLHKPRQAKKSFYKYLNIPDTTPQTAIFRALAKHPDFFSEDLEPFSSLIFLIHITTELGEIEESRQFSKLLIPASIVYDLRNPISQEFRLWELVDYYSFPDRIIEKDYRIIFHFPPWKSKKLFINANLFYGLYFFNSGKIEEAKRHLHNCELVNNVNSLNLVIAKEFQKNINAPHYRHYQNEYR
ncbi:MAG: tetratricopeptide repeat protein [Candidatus Gracilibacteria bacterium]|nr:tetratricopeptide repeat protein [Candidatus Gracilibacteria bacterium]